MTDMEDFPPHQQAFDDKPVLSRNVLAEKLEPI